MAVKTITLDLEAYETLRRHKRQGQSFSEVVKEHFGKPKTAADLLRVLQDVQLAEETIDAIARQVAGRRKSRARAPRL
jgi:predicted CopG family antitoxin